MPFLKMRNDVSYPDAVKADDRYIHIAYDRERGTIYEPDVSYDHRVYKKLFARITQANILAGRLFAPSSVLCHIVSQVVNE